MKSQFIGTIAKIVLIFATLPIPFFAHFSATLHQFADVLDSGKKK
jgi:hypothetical protein